MIAKRIRKSARAARGSIERLRDNIVGLTKYVIDARPWPDVEPGHIRSLSAYVLHASDDTTSPGEKVAATWVSNLQSTSLRDIAAVSSSALTKWHVLEVSPNFISSDAIPRSVPVMMGPGRFRS